MILVTGAGAGIGRACVTALLDRTAADVLITGRRADALRCAHETIPAARRDRVRTHVCDQSDAGDLDRLIARIDAGEPPIEGAILTVGVNPLYHEGPRRLDALDAATIDATIRTNCTHALRLSAALLGRFRRQRGGVLVWIGSRAAREGIPGAGLYGATKAFLSGLAAAAHREYAGRGVRVHLLNPGPVRTPRTAAVVDGFAAKHGITVAEPDDVARRIVDVFLTGDPADVERDL